MQNLAAHERAAAKILRLQSLPIVRPKDMVDRDKQIQEISLELMREYACNLAVAQEKQRRRVAEQKLREQNQLLQTGPAAERRGLRVDRSFLTAQAQRQQQQQQQKAKSTRKEKAMKRATRKPKERQR